MKKAWNKMTDEEAKNKALSYNPNIKILSVIRDDKNSLKFDILCPRCGGKKENLVTMESIKSNKLSCKKCRGLKISETSKKVEYINSFGYNDKYNRIKYWDSKNALSPFEVSKGTRDKYWFVCENGHNFKSSISEVNRGRWCPHCSSLLKESRMATVLKQILKHEFCETVWEYDIGFRGFKGGISAYDIFVPELNLLIECQSEYHDDGEQHKLDVLKKEYAIANGYDFFALDYRDFEILKAVKLFFPYIEKLPDYVEYTKNTLVSWDIIKAQELLNNSDLNQKEVAEAVGADLPSFYDKVLRKILIVPVEKQIKIPIVQLTLQGEFVERYNSAIECSKNGFNTPDICSCCKGNQHTHRGYLFMYESDYENNKNVYGNIVLDKDYNKISLDANKKEVIELSMEGKYIDKYTSLTEAEEKTGFLLSNISACCNHITKTSNGFIWMYRNEYDALKDEFGNAIVSLTYKKPTKEVVCINKLMNLIVYESAREAERATGINYKQISYKCRNKSNDREEYIWILNEDFKEFILSNDMTIDNLNNYKKNKYSK